MPPIRSRGPRGTSRARRTRACLVLVAAAALVLAGCTGEDPGPGPGESSLSARSPLTGLAVDGKAPRRPVAVVKVDNSSRSSPQIGLGKADLVAEELVEGGTTRLAAFYYSRLPRVVGPVRSMRASDIGIVEPADAVLVASGGAPPTVRRVAAAGITTFVDGAAGYFRDASRSAPYNLMMRLPELARSLKPAARPPEYLPWGRGSSLPRGRRARRATAVFSGSHTTSWRFARGRYLPVDGYAPQADRFEPDTLLVLRVEVGDAGYRDPAGNPVPETKLTGGGDAMVFHGGRLVRGTWTKGSLGARLSLSTSAGPLLLPPGRAWIGLVPAAGGNVSVG